MLFKKLQLKIDMLLKRLDQMSLWILGIFVMAVVFVPYIFMGEKSVFVWHDQLDENILHYVLNARHMGEGLKRIPEMMTGVPKSSLIPYGIIFVPLYRFFSPFHAFVIQYAVIFMIAFIGCYACVKILGHSSIMSLGISTIFSLLPFFPVYGASVAGIPMVVAAVILLEKNEKKGLAYVFLFLYASTSQLVFSGYCILVLWGIYIIYKLLIKDINWYFVGGYILLIVMFVIFNIDLFTDFLFDTSNGLSSRIEAVVNAEPFGTVFMRAFLSGGYNAESLIKSFIWQAIGGIILSVFIFSKIDEEAKKIAISSYAVLGVIIICCILSAIFKTNWYTDIRNNSKGILHSFQMDRFFWLIPGLWWIEIGLLVSLLWNILGRKHKLIGLVIILILLLPGAKDIKENSALYMSVNQINNGTDITGYITWEAYYAQDVMKSIDEAIGRDKNSYRVAHLGMNTTPALMYGFYTVDGYANTYPLEYKHKFRKIIELELDKNQDSAGYFDYWGSRCYLFNSQSGTSFMIGKKSGFTYNGLELDWGTLRDLNVDYIFSAGQILDATDQGINEIGYFSSDTSYWGIWVYEL